MVSPGCWRAITQIFAVNVIDERKLESLALAWDRVADDDGCIDLGYLSAFTMRIRVNHFEGRKSPALPMKKDGIVVNFELTDRLDELGQPIIEEVSFRVLAAERGDWDDYTAAAEELTEALADTDTPAKGAYQHSWRSTVQGLATAQSPDVDYLSGEWDYFVPYYERSIAMQDSGTQVDYATVTTNSLSYQGQFGTQEAAMLIMGSWYVATLVAQQESGEADDFEWGIAPAPQYDSSTVDMPVTFGDPTGLGLNAAADEDVVDAAKRFLAYAASEEAAVALAEIGITPAVSTDTVTETFFALDGIPTDELSQFSFSTQDVRPENYAHATSAALDNILNDAHSAIIPTPSLGIAARPRTTT